MKMTMLLERNTGSAVLADAVDSSPIGVTCFRCQGAAGTVEVECTADGVSRIAFLSDDHHANELDAEIEECWMEELRQALTAYLNGERVDFSEFPIDLSSQPSFRRLALEECRKVGYGETVTYRQLATRLNNPAAVRAVGSAMSHNPVPIIIPCHRVLRTDGGLGGFSAPGGVDVKRKLLEMERGSARTS